MAKALAERAQAAMEEREVEKREKKEKKRGRKRSRSRRRRGSSRDSSSSASVKLGRSRTADGIQKIAEDRPGELLRETLESLQRHLSGTSRSDFTPTFSGYLQTVWHQRYPPHVTGARNVHELAVLAEALDLLIAGRLSEAGDLLSQRLKAILRSVEDGEWTTAAQMEINSRGSLSLASPSELREATRAFKFQSTLHRNAKGASKGKSESSTGGRGGAAPTSLPVRGQQATGGKVG
eukprot:6474845-Amphidinium_carterae.1